jgi:uncharacterized membrane protein
MRVDLVLALLMAVLILAVPVAAFAGFVIAWRQRRGIAELSRKLHAHKESINSLRAQIAGLSARLPAPEGMQPEPPTTVETEQIEEPGPAAETTSEEPRVVPQTAAVPRSAPTAAPVQPRLGLEERLASRWFVWLGSATLALAGLFLILYAVEQGWLSPTARMVLGLALGAALTAFGEWVRRSGAQPLIRFAGVASVPGALTGAGLFVLFASIYGAYALYGLIGSAAAFGWLAAVALGAFVMAALHSPIVAVVGLLAGFLTPALVSADAPSASGLFGYLALVLASALGVVRYRKWLWLAAGALAGGLAWAVIWLVSSYQPGDLLTVTSYLTLLAAASLWLALAETSPEAPEVWRSRHVHPNPEGLAWVTCLATALLVGWAVAEAKGGPVAVVTLVLLTAASYLFGRKFQRFDGLTVVVGVLVLTAVALWPLESIIERALAEVAGRDGQLFTGFIAPTAAGFLVVASGLAALALGLGYVLLFGARHPQLWAGVSTLTAVLLLALVYSRLRIVSEDVLWAGISILGGAMALGAAASLDRHRGHRPMRLALGVYATATVAGVAFAMAFLLRDAWLTVALSMMLPALAWIAVRLDLSELRTIALVIASVVLVRLVLNPFLLEYEAEAFLGRHWVLYGYGVPAAAFYAAMRLFRVGKEDRTVQVLEGGALTFALLTIALELRVLVAGSIEAPRFGLIEASLQSAVWLAAGWWRARAYVVSGRALDLYSGVLLMGLGASCVALVQVLGQNPLMTTDSVGPWPLLNVLALAYLAPAVFAVLILHDSHLRPLRELRLSAALAALVLVLLWSSLEVRHWFQGEVLLLTRGTTNGEYYALSAAWLVLSLSLLAAGVLRGDALYRHGALAVLLLTISKVFLFDMAELQGLYRVASFLGLGLSLVGIGFLYQRFSFHQHDGRLGDSPPGADLTGTPNPS